MTKVITVINHKGGTGKTTTTINLGKALQLKNYQVLLIDFDPQANLSQSLGQFQPKYSIYASIIENKPLPVISLVENFSLIPAELNLAEAESKLLTHPEGYYRLKSILDPIRESYDFILIDCPPSLGLLTFNACFASTDVLIPVQSQFLATQGLHTIIDLLKTIQTGFINPNLCLLGLFLTMTERTVLSHSVAESLRDEYGEKLWQTIIRKNIALAECPAVGQDIFTYAPDSNGAKDYQSLAEELLVRLKLEQIRK